MSKAVRLTQNDTNTKKFMKQRKENPMSTKNVHRINTEYKRKELAF